MRVISVVWSVSMRSNAVPRAASSRATDLADSDQLLTNS
jgi:hypothetical protein